MLKRDDSIQTPPQDISLFDSRYIRVICVTNALKKNA